MRPSREDRTIQNLVAPRGLSYYAPIANIGTFSYNLKKTSWLSSGYRHGLAIATLFLEPFRAHARGLGLSLDQFKLYIPNLKHSLAVGQFEQTVSRGDPSSPIPDLWKRA